MTVANAPAAAVENPAPSSSRFSEQSQLWILRWGIAMAVIFAFCFIFLLKQVPLRNPEWSADRIATFYSDNNASIKWGAVITSWTSAFMMAILTVVAVQMARVEIGGAKIWSQLALVSGAMMSLFQVLPPLFWGVAAYTQNRAVSETTAVLHEIGCVIMATTDQYYIFLWVGISVLCFRPATATVPNNPFPRWWGYMSLWITFMFEAGAFAFIPRTGPLAWDGLLVFWTPFTLFAVWITAWGIAAWSHDGSIGPRIEPARFRPVVSVESSGRPPSRDRCQRYDNADRQGRFDPYDWTEYGLSEHQ